MRLLILGLLAASLSLSAAAQPTPRPYPVAFIGQSMIQGPGDKTLSPVVGPNGLAWQANATGSTGSWEVANDPQSPYKVASMKSQTGSIIPATVNALLADSARVSEVRATVYAMSGTHLLRRATESPSNDWGPGGQLRAAAFKQIGLMLASTACPDSLKAMVVDLGQSDGYRLALYPTALAPFPDGMIVDSAAHPLTGAIVSYPTGYANPSNLPNLYDAEKGLFLDIFSRYPGVRIILNVTAFWGPNTGSLTHQRGCRQVQWVQRRVVSDLQAAGYNIRLNRLPLSFAGRGLVKADGVHYTQPALNELGASDATLILAP